MKSFLKILIITILCGNANAQWVQVYSNSPSQSCYALKFYNVNTGYHSGVLYNSSTFNIYKTTNGGINWVAQNSGYTAQRFMSIFIKHPDTVFISGNYGKILRTFNGGQNWNTVYSDTNLQLWGIKFVNSFTGFAAGSSGTVLKTTNKGNNWTFLNTGVINALQGIYFLNETTGFVSGSIIILKTTNAGDSWINLNAPNISFETNTDVYFENESAGIISTNSGRIIRTSDGGANWAIVREQSGDAVWRMSFTDSQTGYGCTSNGNSVKTTNAGINWFNQSTPLTENLYDINFPAAGTGYICSWSGKILKTTHGGGNTVSVFNETDELPEDIILNQNYPNPFNPGTKISFKLIEQSDVTLKVYDASGNEVKDIVSRQFTPGDYEFKFDGSDLASGVYFYKMYAKTESGFKTFVKNMILLK